MLAYCFWIFINLVSINVIEHFHQINSKAKENVETIRNGCENSSHSLDVGDVTMKPSSPDGHSSNNVRVLIKEQLIELKTKLHLPNSLDDREADARVKQLQEKVN